MMIDAARLNRSHPESTSRFYGLTAPGAHELPPGATNASLHDHSNDAFEIVVNIFLFPIISLMGFCFNATCIVVYWKIIRQNREKRKALLARPNGARLSRVNRHNEDLYMYLITSSISTTICMFIDIFAPLALCHIEFCKLSKSYFAQIYYLYGYIYLADVFETFSSLIDIVITIDRYAIIFNRFKFIQRNFNYKRILVILFLICTLYYVPFILRKKIISIRKNVVIKLDEMATAGSGAEFTSTLHHGYYTSHIKSFEQYTIIDSEFGTKKLSKLFLILQLFISELLVFIIMITFNILLAFSFREPHYIERPASSGGHFRRSNNSLRSDLKQNVAKICESASNHDGHAEHMASLLVNRDDLSPSCAGNKSITDDASTAENGTRIVPLSTDSTNSLTRAYQCSFIGKNHKQTNFNLREYNLTLMIITMSFVNLIGNSPLVIVFSLNFFFNMENSVMINNLYILSNLSTLITYSTLIFIYYYFNSLFRETLNGLIFKKK